MKQPDIRDLALIGDRNTCALLDRQGTLCWYSPDRFDGSAAFSLLLDEERGGYWAVHAEQKRFTARAYAERGSILTTRYTVADEPFEIVDWMPLGDDFGGLCRSFSTAPAPVTNRFACDRITAQPERLRNSATARRRHSSRSSSFG